MIKIFKYLKGKEWLQALISLVFIVVQVWLDLKLPDYMSKITRLVQTPDSAISEIWKAGGYMLLCALGSLAIAIIVGFFAARIAASFSKRLRSMLFSKVESFSMAENQSLFNLESDYTLHKRYYTGSDAGHNGTADDCQGTYYGGLGNYENSR